MMHIVFEYADQWSDWEWRRQECCVSSVEECKRLYGLGRDCRYRILLVEEERRDEHEQSGKKDIACKAV